MPASKPSDQNWLYKLWGPLKTKLQDWTEHWTKDRPFCMWSLVLVHRPYADDAGLPSTPEFSRHCFLPFSSFAVFFFFFCLWHLECSCLLGMREMQEWREVQRLLVTFLKHCTISWEDCRHLLGSLLGFVTISFIAIVQCKWYFRIQVNLVIPKFLCLEPSLLPDPFCWLDLMESGRVSTQSRAETTESVPCKWNPHGHQSLSQS